MRAISIVTSHVRYMHVHVYMCMVHACSLLYMHVACMMVQHLVYSLSFYPKKSNYKNDVIG